MSSGPPFDPVELTRQIRDLAERLEKSQREFNELQKLLSEVHAEAEAIQEYIRETRKAQGKSQ
jgi:predicted nuclease with TOPRIM domain